jgi:hypothetical protein
MEGIPTWRGSFGGCATNPGSTPKSARARPKNGRQIPHFFLDRCVRFTNFGEVLKKLPAH